MKILIILFISILLIGSVSTKLFEVTLFNSKDYEQGIKLIDKNSTNIVTRHIDYKNYVMKDSDGYSYTLSQGTSVSKRILGGYRLETIDGLSCTFDWDSPTELAISDDKIDFQQGNLSDISCNWDMEYLGNDIYLVGGKYYLDIDPSFFTNDTSSENNWTAGVFVNTTTDGQNVTLNTTPIDSETKLLLHLNGAEGATSIVDFSSSNHSITFNGDAHINTSESKFGGSSVLFDGTGDDIAVPDSDDWDFGGSDFTLDLWVYLTATGGNYALISHGQTNGETWEFHYLGSSKNFQWQTESSAETDLTFTKSWNAALNTWYHIALVRSGDDWRTYVDGTQVGSTTSSSSNVPAEPGALAIGGRGWSSGNKFDGFIDEVRVSKGIARWTGNFTPPAKEYPLFETSGNYTSQVFDAGSSSTWDTLAWTNVSSTGNNITFQVMSCDDASCSGETWVGPDNTSSTYFLTQPVTLNTSITPNTQYFSYAAFFETNASSLSETSYLQDVNISYSSADANPPTFNESLLNQTVGAGAELNYTVNCTDIEGGVTVTENVTGTETSHYSIFTSATQLFQFRPSYFEFRRSGFHVNVTCDDGVNTISDTFFVNVTEATGTQESCDLGCMIISSGCTATLGGGCTTINS